MSIKTQQAYITFLCYFRLHAKILGPTTGTGTQITLTDEQNNTSLPKDFIL